MSARTQKWRSEHRTCRDQRARSPHGDPEAQREGEPGARGAARTEPLDSRAVRFQREYLRAMLRLVSPAHVSDANNTVPGCLRRPR